MSGVLRWIRKLLLLLSAVLILAGAALYFRTQRSFSRDYTIDAPAVQPAEGKAAVERGRYLVDAVTKCKDCHGEDLGGAAFFEDAMVGHLDADNLTAGEGGIGASFEIADWQRAIRHGVGPDGKPLLFMPAQEYQSLSDEDLAAILAYILQLPPVDRDRSSRRIGPMARLLYATGQLELVPAELIDHEAERAQAPQRGATATYGAYLVDTGGCRGCHGPGLSGGPIPGAPPGTIEARNITPDEASGIGGWSEDDFRLAMRSGMRPDGSILDPFMPYKAVGKLDDADLHALWLYLRTVEPKEAGGR
jgi:mono/diheme cytochrome c family protein